MLPWRGLLRKDSIPKERSKGRAACTKTVSCPRISRVWADRHFIRRLKPGESKSKTQKLTGELGRQDRLEIIRLNGIDTFDTKDILFKGRTRFLKDLNEPLQGLFLCDDAKCINDQIQRKRPFILKRARSATTVSSLEPRISLTVSCQ